MTRADEVLINAKAALNAFKSNEDYQWLKIRHDAITPKESKRINLDNILWYANGLAKAIQDDDLIAMRRKEKYRSYLEYFTRYRLAMEKIIVVQEPDLFCLSACALDISDKTNEFEEREHIFSEELIGEELTKTPDVQQTVLHRICKTHSITLC